MAKGKSSSSTEARGSKGETSASATTGTVKARDALSEPHTKITDAITKLNQATDQQQKLTALRTLVAEWLSHHRVVGEAFYAEFDKRGIHAPGLDEILIEQDLGNLLLQDLLDREPEDTHFDAEVRVVGKFFPRILKLEANAKSGLLALAREAGLDVGSLNDRIRQGSGASGERAESPIFPPRPRILRGAGKTRDKQENPSMANYRERDERGRFRDEDDRYERHRGGYREDERRYGSRGRDDDEGRGWYGDREGHSRAAERGWESRRSEYRDRDRDEDYERRGRHQDDDERRYSRGGGGGGGGGGRGWYGDPEGHSEASRRGWDERRDYRRDEDDERRYRSRGADYDDDRRSHRSSRDEDDDRRSSYGRGGHGGWFGDSEGHSEASRRGWEDRRRG